jgi:hypothetical protein
MSRCVLLILFVAAFIADACSPSAIAQRSAARSVVTSNAGSAPGRRHNEADEKKDVPRFLDIHDSTLVPALLAIVQPQRGGS